MKKKGRKRNSLEEAKVIHGNVWCLFSWTSYLFEVLREISSDCSEQGRINSEKGQGIWARKSLL